ncbi:MAG: hypothetical protein CSA42_02540 [Gammaproteobacteria bacterium]|nr:MAG: hypothetical protein CSA42_02540 [Gammaproteobacteria bacterium]
MTLPPLNALKAFDAAGRHQSFMLAAQELHVSPASISRFIKQLETNLGLTLFVRHANGVSLTEQGEQYLLAVQPSLQTIAAVSERFRQQNVKTKLKIVAIPAIAETWLVNRLWSFQQQHEEIQINLVMDDQLVVDDQLVPLHPNEATIVLNYSHGDREGADCFAMPKDKLTLVCNHEVAQTLKQPNDIYKHNLLVDADWKEDWYAWLKAATLPTDLPKQYQEFERYSMVLHATLAGLGVAIGHTTLLKSYLKTGALVAPFDVQATSTKQFYAVVAKNTQRESVKAFVNWFIGQPHF